ncbi:phenylacetate--CoA ligase family protein [Kitasatospora sp. NBC_01302]|uniref:phenylacetate--CoA ligase family protein n=1 Tax=Kitasatospora sp. NBC_01302 TaxID=2903575 RepID=UPI002E13D8F9|nr:phenylacetate--CoA ligase family protein [Kitasatospora sp. NBC_01302]
MTDARPSDPADLIAFARAHSPFYRDLYAHLPADVADLRSLPLIDHTAFWEAHTVADSKLLTGPHTDGIVFKTGGTTGMPRISFYTRPEWRAMAGRFSAGLTAAGVEPGDRVANLFYAGELYSSFVFTLNLFQEAPVATVQLPIGGAATPEQVVATMRDFSATVIAALPTSLSRLAREVVDTVGSMPLIRLALFSGEAFHDDQLPLIKQAFPHITVRSIGYASVDAGVLAAPVAGEFDNRVHQVLTPEKVVELLDPVTGEPIEEPGRAGRVVATDLVRRLTPMIRYPVGDLAEWVDFPSRTLRLLGRAEEGARVGPVSIFLEDLRALVTDTDAEGRIGGLQVVVRHFDGRDQMTLRLADSTPQATGRDTLEAAIIEQLDVRRPLFTDQVARGAIHPVAVEWVGPTGLTVNPRSGKAIRLLDERLDERLNKRLG